jgi:hypothetical protein
MGHITVDYKEYNSRIEGGNIPNALPSNDANQPVLGKPIDRGTDTDYSYQKMYRPSNNYGNEKMKR